MSRDPYSVVADALWSILEGDGEFTKAVAVGNRIRFTGENRDPIKAEVSTADLPEVRIVVSASTPHAKGSSGTAFDTARYEIQVSSGDQRIDCWHLPLKWIIFKAMTKARQEWTQLGTTLKWNEKRFISMVRAVSVSEGVSQNDLNRGIKGWSALWAIEVEMFFALADIT